MDTAVNDLHLFGFVCNMCDQVFLVKRITSLVYLVLFTVSLVEGNEGETVDITHHTSIKYFNVPTSSEPVISWMDVQRGLFPNTSQITSSLKVGEPITVFIYLQDQSYLYDIKVTDCWAYDEDNISNSKYKLHLTRNDDANSSLKNSTIMKNWKQYNFPKSSNMKTFIYTDLKAFKFPDKDQIHITCDVELCFKTCSKREKKIDPN